MKYSSDKVTALYHRTAHKSIEPHLENQIKKLLCYVAQNDLSSYVLYMDDGVSGLTLDRPALLAMMAAMQAGRIDKIVVADIARISRNLVNTVEFIKYSRGLGVTISTLSGEEALFPDEITFVASASAKGGERR